MKIRLFGRAATAVYNGELEGDTYQDGEVWAEEAAYEVWEESDAKAAQRALDEKAAAQPRMSADAARGLR